MSKSLLILYLFVGGQMLAKAQLFTGAQNFLQPSGLLNAIDQNQQQLNPAASCPKAQKGFYFYASVPLQIANLNGAYFSCFYTQNRWAIYHEFSGVFHPAGHFFQTAHALAFAPYPGLHIGLGLQVQLFTQPNYYGNLLVASARLGCQYELKKRQHLALVLQDIGRVAQQQISIEHLLELDERLSFAQGLSWNPQFKPNLYLTLTQKLSQAKIQFTCGLFPQSYAFSLALTQHKHFTWMIGQRWQSAHGLSFQIGLNLH
ncbi:MAG: hypothetical protein RL331_1211 [Bacteroidota bacterium]|jgi:hypothetical protein